MAKAKNEVVVIEMKDLVEEINLLFGEFVAHMKMSLQLAVKIGGRLVEAKNQVPHGGWDSWVQVNLPFTARHARRYISVYENREDLLKLEEQGVEVTLKNSQRLLAFNSSEEDVDESMEMGEMETLKERLKLQRKEIDISHKQIIILRERIQKYRDEGEPKKAKELEPELDRLKKQIEDTAAKARGMEDLQKALTRGRDFFAKELTVISALNVYPAAQKAMKAEALACVEGVETWCKAIREVFDV